MHPGLRAALAAAVLALALGSAAVGPAAALVIRAPVAPAVISAVDICTQYDCYPVTITLTGGGSGRAQSTDAQFVPDGIIDCRIVRGVVDTTLCSHKYPDTTGANGVVVYLKVTPDTGSELCDEIGCRTEARSLSKFFTAAGTFSEAFNILVLDVHLAKAGSGSGRITSDPSYLDCGTSCETSLEYGEQLAFIADPDPGSKFSKWTGACAGQKATCRITLTSDVTATATFTKLAAATIEPSAEATEVPPTEAPSAVPSVEPTAAPPTLAPTVEPTSPPVEPVADSGTAGLIPIVIGIAVVVLIAIGVGTAIAMRRKPAL